MSSAVQSATFYTFLHLNTNAAVASHSVESESNLPADFTGTAWNLIAVGDTDITTDHVSNDSVVNVNKLLKQIQEFTEDITARVKEPLWLHMEC